MDVSWAQLGMAKQLVIDFIGATPDRFDLSPCARLVDDLGADSLDFVEIQCALEEHGVEAPDDAFHRHMTLGDLATLIKPRPTYEPFGRTPMAHKLHNTCDECRHWHKGYRLQGMKVPDFCNRHFHSQRGDDPACPQFQAPTHAD